ncbi:E3 ubiquitin-protein ligase makorin-2 [Spea bombifrons]|uniref:E3 ubiquitin-protein ligase makorin-2 n=1 Tax=Spea bombifrons TaxID=233779 RepID=UPI002349B4F1|nr:E3 ubiquitin-protein ligase makorin-2 [Spea bombifrons]
MSTRHVTCRYFLHGVCREGPRCLFSHDLATSKPSTICRFYQKGQCAYGARCRYDHVKPAGSPQGLWIPDPSCAAWKGPPLPTPGQEAAEAAPTSTPPRREKKSLVLCDRDLCGLSEGNPQWDPVPGHGHEAHGTEGEAKPHSYLEAICTGLEEVEVTPTRPPDSSQLCPYAAAGGCHYGEKCVYLHGDACGICGLRVLHPHDQEQRMAHEKLCMASFERDMEKAFAFQASEEKVCSVCMEVVYEKPSATERRFGILSSCSHVYCLSCIRQWRCAKQFDNPVIKSCPECRVVSEFVIPSVYWVDDQSKKNELIEAFKQGMGKKACKYFDQGRGSCPFGGKCLYLHAYPDGTRAEPEKPRKQLGSEGTVRFFNSVRLWDFIEDRENRSATGNEGDDVADLGDLFMHLSGVDREDATPE